MSKPDAPHTLNGVSPKRTRKRQTVPLRVPDDQEEDGQEAELDDECAAEVTEGKTDWLWPDCLEWGTVAMFQGAKGAGKSTWLRAIAAHVTGGPALPGTRKPKKPLGNVLWYCGEESKRNRVIPCLKAAGADVKRCFVSDAFHEDQRKRLALPMDADRLRRRIAYRGAVIVIIDPLFCFLDATANVEGPTQLARDYMRAVAKVAEDTGALIILSRNLTKDTTKGAVASGRGSGELGNAARSVIHCQELPECKESFALAVAACNNGRPKPAVLYHLADKGGYPIIGIDGTSNITADDLVAGDEGDTDRYMLEQAKELVRQMVGKDRIDSKIVKAKAEAAMINVRTLQKAAKNLKVRYSRVGTREHTTVYWSAPKGGYK